LTDNISKGDDLLPRKYVDLVHICEGKYASWEPSIPHNLGDFGYINKESGAFQCQGNIFEGPFAEKHSSILAALGDPVELPPDKFRVITSSNVKAVEIDQHASM
jgi:hypothetical protein